MIKKTLISTLQKAHAQWVANPALHVESFPNWFAFIYCEAEFQNVPIWVGREIMDARGVEAREYLALIVTGNVFWDGAPKTPAPKFDFYGGAPLPLAMPKP